MSTAMSAYVLAEEAIMPLSATLPRSDQAAFEAPVWAAINQMSPESSGQGHVKEPPNGCSGSFSVPRRRNSSVRTGGRRSASEASSSSETTNPRRRAATAGRGRLIRLRARAWSTRRVSL